MDEPNGAFLQSLFYKWNELELNANLSTNNFFPCNFFIMIDDVKIPTPTLPRGLEVRNLKSSRDLPNPPKLK